MAMSRGKGESEPMTLGNALAADHRLIVWCKACGHQSEPDVATQVAQHGTGVQPRAPVDLSPAPLTELIHCIAFGTGAVSRFVSLNVLGHEDSGLHPSAHQRVLNVRGTAPLATYRGPASRPGARHRPGAIREVCGQPQ